MPARIFDLVQRPPFPHNEVQRLKCGHEVFAICVARASEARYYILHYNKLIETIHLARLIHSKESFEKEELQLKIEIAK